MVRRRLKKRGKQRQEEEDKKKQEGHKEGGSGGSGGSSGGPSPLNGSGRNRIGPELGGGQGGDWSEGGAAVAVGLQGSSRGNSGNRGEEKEGQEDDAQLTSALSEPMFGHQDMSGVCLRV